MVYIDSFSYEFAENDFKIISFDNIFKQFISDEKCKIIQYFCITNDAFHVENVYYVKIEVNVTWKAHVDSNFVFFSETKRGV